MSLTEHDTTSSPCPGACNREWRHAEQKRWAEIARRIENGDSTPVPPHNVDPQPGEPIWCRGCQMSILDALQRLPTLAADAAAMPDGRLATTGTTDGRVATRTGSPSGSPGWDLADEIMRWVMSWEDALREHLGQPPINKQIRAALYTRGQDRRLAAIGPLLKDPAQRRRLVDAVRYLAERGTALLSWADAGTDAGREILALASRAEALTGRDKLVHRLNVDCPRDECGRRALRRKDGSELVKCSACGACWDYEQFQFLARVATTPRTETGMITVADAAELHAVSEATVHTWIRRYSIPTVKMRGVLYVSDEALTECAALRRDEPRGRKRRSWGVPA